MKRPQAVGVRGGGWSGDDALGEGGEGGGGQ
jgi:hypothetical protein